MTPEFEGSLFVGKENWKWTVSAMDIEEERLRKKHGRNGSASQNKSDPWPAPT